MVDLADAAVVAILTRAPSRGGKSRLFGELGSPSEPALLTALLCDTLDATNVSGVIRLVAVEPADACDEVRELVPGDVRVIGQSGGTLGDRMRVLMSGAFDAGARSIVLVGSDLPDLTSAVVAEAVALLDEHRDALVLGPAIDGGYYLIGAARTTPPVFDGIEWGTSNVLSATVRRAEEHGLRAVLLNPMSDVDTVADLRRVKASRTRAWIGAHLREE